MKASQLETNNHAITLVEPDVERDSQLGVAWLEGELGRDTLHLMGVPDAEITATTVEKERHRVQQFIDDESQLNWMIQYNTFVVGSVWVNVTETEGLTAPSVHIMIGDPAMRGKGVGRTVIERVTEYLSSQQYGTVYSRHLLENKAAETLLLSLGFQDFGEAYTDGDGLAWQNMLKNIS